MSWAEAVKINSNLSVPLNERLKGLSVVKGVQRGLSTSAGTNAVTVTINPVNLDKTFVMVKSRYSYRINSGSVQQLAMVQNMTSNQITFYPHYHPFSASVTTATGAEFSWQIIEFR